jgi:hypothetical protein
VAKENFLSRALLVGPAFVTALVVTNSVTDPVNNPKFVALSVFAAAAFSVIGKGSLRFLWMNFKLPTIAILVFLIASLNSLLFSSAPFSQSLYGVYGRSNGILLYIFLSMVFISILHISQIRTFENIIRSLLIAGIINVVYCLWVLSFGDFIGWSNPYGNILGTLGNPNFIGSFLGIFSSVVVSYCIYYFKKLKILISLVVLTALTFFEIVQSHAIQGRVLFAVGIAINLYFVIRAHFSYFLVQFSFMVLSGVIGIVAVLGTLQIGPLSAFLYKDSVSLRGEYWYAGLVIGKNHLLSGVGFDSYGDWYRTARRASALVRPGPNTVSNSAHNVFIDIFAFGGLPLFLGYLTINILVIFSIIRQIRLIHGFNPLFVSLVGAWVGYQIQSIISINQIGLAIWGWILGAAILGYERLGSLSNLSTQKSMGQIKRTIKTEPIISVTVRASILVGLTLFLSVPPLSADMKWRSAQESRDLAKIEESLNPSYWNPSSTFKFLTTVGSIQDSNFPDIAKEYAVKAIEFNPHSYESWRAFTLLPNATQVEKEVALKKMAELDPLNPDVTTQ